MRSANIPRLLLAVAWALACVPALGQRVEIPTPLPNSGMPPSPADAGPAPMASLEGTIQTNPAPWDPYAVPGTATPSLLSQDPYIQSGTFAGTGATFTSMRRLVDDLRVESLWMPGNADTEMGITDLDLSVTFAIPFLYNTETPLRVKSAFAFHWWTGPAGRTGRSARAGLRLVSRSKLEPAGHRMAQRRVVGQRRRLLRLQEGDAARAFAFRARA